ncbi:MAG: hypothetical protein KF749_09475 [Bacteroidetes bacterium]|nr:hypothetical protein [Bacteroidota bacterium]MCW5894855.1 hypothetical protein [Bacteroidota bacterium]
MKYDYRRIDEYAISSSPEVEKSVETLSGYLLAGAANDREKVRSVFRWIAGNIVYDIQSFFVPPARKPTKRMSGNNVLQTRTALCGGYAELFEMLLKPSGIAVVTISGYGKGYGYTEREPFEGKEPNHAWNAVQIDGTWFLVDATWGSGYANDERQYVKALDESYFLTPPEYFSFDHFPMETKWQLLSVPISLQEFEKRPVLRPSFFELGFSVEQACLLLAEKEFNGFPDLFTFSGGDVYFHSVPHMKELQVGKRYYFQLTAPNAKEIVLINDITWCFLSEQNGLFYGEIAVKEGDLTVGLRNKGQDSLSYQSVLRYIVQ